APEHDVARSPRALTQYRLAAVSPDHRGDAGPGNIVVRKITSAPRQPGSRTEDGMTGRDRRPRNGRVGVEGCTEADVERAGIVPTCRVGEPAAPGGNPGLQVASVGVHEGFKIQRVTVSTVQDQESVVSGGENACGNGLRKLKVVPVAGPEGRVHRVDV